MKDILFIVWAVVVLTSAFIFGWYLAEIIFRRKL